MAKPSELLRTLYLVRHLSKGPQTREALCRDTDASPVTIARQIRTARELGADIRARQIRRTERGWEFSLDNWPNIEQQVRTWIDLEEHGLDTSPKTHALPQAEQNVEYLDY